MTPEEILQYQKDSKFVPDKTPEWEYPIEEDHWMISHNALRGEMEQIQTALKNVDEAEEWKILSLQKIWTYHKDHTIAHHKSEEEILQPFLETRINYPTKASQGHDVIEKSLQELDEKIQNLKTKDDIEEFTKEFEKYHKELMLPHLEAEESLSMVLLRAYFSQMEFKETGKRMGKEGGHSGSFVYFAGEDKFRNELMGKWGMPSFVWYVAFSKQLKEYQVGVLKHVEALETNSPPPEDESCAIQ